MLLFGVIFIAGASYAIEEIFYDSENNPVIPTWDLPNHLIPLIESHEAVIDVTEGVLDSGQPGYLITLDISASPVSQNEAIRLIRELEWIAITHQARMDWHVGGYELPDCQWDYGTGQVIGVYWYNGEQVVVQGDDKC